MRRLGISLLLVVVMAVVGAGWAIDRLFVALNTPDQSLETVRSVGAQLAFQMDESGQTLNEAISQSAESGTGFRMSLVDRDELFLPPSLQSVLDSGNPLTLESEEGVSAYFLLTKTDRVLSVDLPQPADTRLRLLLTLLFYASIACLILLWLYPLVRRIQRLARTAKRFGEGEFEQRIATHRRSQLFDIETEFNKMAQRIQDLVNDNKLLSGAVSHDLRTPLARLRFGVDALSEQVNDPVQQDYLSRISIDLSSMEELVEVLLEFARLDQRLTELPLQSISLSDFVKESIQLLELSESVHIELHDDIDGKLIRGEPRFIRMLVNNILNNAVKFCSKKIVINIHSEAGRLSLSVEDDGPGFLDDKPAELVKPFKRGASSNSVAGYSGHGMGLAIVQRIAIWHDAQIEMSDSDRYGGAKVSIAFPIVN